jgi:ubiquitin-conjugating enzyme E2 W
MSIASRRLGKELVELKANNGCPTGVTLVKADDFQTWYFTLEVLGETLYKGEVFALRFTFSQRYPIEVPEVVFVVDEKYKAPIHPHIYTNGHICASILGPEWSPVLSVAAVALTLQSMLASCKKKEKPEGNDEYVRHAPLSPKHTRFAYDDDTV